MLCLVVYCLWFVERSSSMSRLSSFVVRCVLCVVFGCVLCVVCGLRFVVWGLWLMCAVLVVR